jgi:hypothetical protein
MKTIKITSTFTAKVPNDFKIVQMHEEVDGELIPTMTALKVGKKLAIPDMFFLRCEAVNGSLEEMIEDDDLKDKIWSYFPTVDHEIEIL